MNQREFKKRWQRKATAESPPWCLYLQAGISYSEALSLHGTDHEPSLESLRTLVVLRAGKPACC